MESYIVRIYRRSRDGQRDRSDSLIGVVETSDGAARHSFSGAEELWSVLVGAAGELNSTPARNTPEKKRR